MTREAESQLLDFCVQQRETFSLAEWLRFRPVKKEVLATAALFLSGVDWYGHREQLLDVTDRTTGGFAHGPGGLRGEVSRNGEADGFFMRQVFQPAEGEAET